ncbi:hypothetical protein QCA50_007372 [Cerrena zonata]|uniref:Uncharacterized protein n=1 Tax=Cerrena zonata TaxID=2478898 RepID=A0AAW0G805_9APHY
MSDEVVHDTHFTKPTMTNAYASWKRVPTTSSAILGLDLPYRPPKNPIGAFLWRRRIWLETTFGLSLLEPWEKILVLVIIYLIVTLMLAGLYEFIPQQITPLYNRLLYYLFGHELNGDVGVSLRRLVVERQAGRDPIQL